MTLKGFIFLLYYILIMILWKVNLDKPQQTIANNKKHIENYWDLLYNVWWKNIACRKCGGMRMDSLNVEKWINIDEAADYLGVKPGTIRDWIRKGNGIPAHKIGKQWKFKCSELDAWVKSGSSAIEWFRTY